MNLSIFGVPNKFSAETNSNSFAPLAWMQGILPPLSSHSASLELEQQLQSELDNPGIVACGDDVPEIASIEHLSRCRVDTATRGNKRIFKPDVGSLALERRTESGHRRTIFIPDAIWWAEWQGP